MAPLVNNVHLFGVCFVVAVMLGHSERIATTIAGPKVAWPASVLNDKFKQLKHLGTGSFGESWLVEGLPGTPYAQKKVVVKLFYAKHNDQYVHLTKKVVEEMREECEVEHDQKSSSSSSSSSSVSSSSSSCKKEAAKLQKGIDKAVEECDIAMKLQKAAPLMSNGIYAQRLMGCFGHNYREKRRDIPIYVVLENCGVQNLNGYIKDHRSTLTASQMASITRQILEGLEFLGNMKPWPVIHHDLKPDNIVVKEFSGGAVSVHLIDFGGMMYADPDDMKVSSTSTVDYAPKEWVDDDDAFREPATSFDIYSVGNILAKMATGNKFNNVFLDENEDTDFEAIDEEVASETSRTEFVKLLHEQADEEFKGVDAIDKDREEGGARDFTVAGWAHTVHTEPGERPTPAALLALPWLQNADSPNDPDWTMISMTVLADELPVYWPGDLVKVKSVSKDKWFTDGKVHKVFDDGQVEVRYNFRGDDVYSYKTLDADEVDKELEKIQSTFSVDDRVWVWSDRKQQWYTDGIVKSVSEKANGHVKVKYNNGQKSIQRRKADATKYFKKVADM